MQIVAGRFRRRKLETNPGDTTRPLLTRVKVALFDRIEPLLKNARVADIYSGTGTIGLEALSRGASRVTFLEADRKAFELLRRNITSLKVEDETLTWKTDVTKCSFRPRKSEGFLPFDVIFFDPPYSHLYNLAPGTMLYRSLQRLARDGISSPGTWLLVRCEEGTEFAMPAAWQKNRNPQLPVDGRPYVPPPGDPDRRQRHGRGRSGPRRPGGGTGSRRVRCRRFSRDSGR